MNDKTLIWRSVLVIVAAGLALACGGPESTATQSSSTAASSQPADAASLATAADTPQNPEDKMPRVSVQEAIKQQKDGTALIIDVRGTEAYNIAHIKGALDINLSKLEGGDFQGLPNNKNIIAYCT